MEVRPVSTIENLFGSSARAYTESGGYDQKAELLECISFGDLERVADVTDRYIRHLRDLVRDDIDCARDAMYFVWAQFNLAATRGGLSEYQAHDIHKGYYSRLEHTDSVEETLNMCRQHTVELCKAVSIVRQELSYSEPAASCCAYIREHIYEKLTVDGIADALHFGKSYLSHRFHEETGVTILAFIHREKIEEAKLLLRSHIPISDIAEELGFSLQSHFTAVFKRFTGITPHKFRSSI